MEKLSLGFIKTAGLLILALTSANCGAGNEQKVDAASGASPRRSSGGEIYYRQSASDIEKNLPVQARDLYFIFTENENEALKSYSGKQIKVEGTVKYIGPDAFSNPSLEISDSKSGKTYVICVFQKSGDLKDLSVGDAVTVTGNFHIISSSDSVVLKKCTVTPGK